MARPENFDRQRLWRELGHASLFSYLRRELRLSAGAAQYRKTATELIQRFSEVEAALRDGRLCLSTVIEVAKVLTAENRHEVLPRFIGLSRREAEAVAASIRPAEVVPRRAVVTAIRPAAAAVVAEVPRAPTATQETPALAFRPAETPPGVPSGPLPPVAAPPPRDRTKLEAAKDALSHAKPGATEEEILEAGLDLLLAKHAKRKGLVEKPREMPPPSRSDAVPAHVKRAVWSRAGGRCEWRFDSGEVCGSTHQLEFDHHPVPRARGGLPTIENIRVLCHAHNQLAARRFFGDACIDRYTGRNGKTVAPPDAPALFPPASS